VLYKEAEAVEFGAWARTVPTTDRNASLDDRALYDKHQPDDERTPAEPAGLDTDVSEPDRIYDTLFDSAWHLDHAQSTTNRKQSSTAASHGKTTTASNPRTQRQHHRPSVRYRTAYECSVCGGVRELEISLRVCPFVDECANCGAIARFTAGGIPTTLRKD
jgi:hypothetical protein